MFSRGFFSPLKGMNVQIQGLDFWERRWKEKLMEKQADAEKDWEIKSFSRWGNLIPGCSFYAGLVGSDMVLGMFECFSNGEGMIYGFIYSLFRRELRLQVGQIYTDSCIINAQSRR